MDPLASGTPHPVESLNAPARIEAAERLRFLAHSGAAGLLTGEAGTGKTSLFCELAGRLRREGLAVAQIDLSGTAAREVPHLVAARLGLGVQTGGDDLEVFSLLQDHAEASRRLNRKLVFLVDHLDHAEASALTALNRLMNAFGASSAWILAIRPSHLDSLQQCWPNRAWLRIELPSLRRDEAAKFLTRELGAKSAPVRISRQAVDTAWTASHGRIQRLRQLAELTALALEADGTGEVDAELIEAVTDELYG